LHQQHKLVVLSRVQIFGRGLFGPRHGNLTAYNRLNLPASATACEFQSAKQVAFVGEPPPLACGAVNRVNQILAGRFAAILGFVFGDFIAPSVTNRRNERGGE